MSRRQPSWWGWGFVGDSLDDAEIADLARTLSRLSGRGVGRPRPVPEPSSLALPAPRIRPPATLAARCRVDPWARAGHAMGKAFRDVARALAGRIDHPPDVVVTPRSEEEVVAVLEWCSTADIAIVPYGGGSSVVGGVEPDVGDRPAVSLDLGALDRVLEVDERSLAVRVEAGILGPTLEEALRPHGLTVRHFPQSFERSTVGGWIATRSIGHFATGRSRIDDCVEALRAWSPRGAVETRRLPASGAGPSPDRLLIGSEGTLAVITEAWLRVLRRPVHRSQASVAFGDTAAAIDALRRLAQSGLLPATLRLLDPTEAALAGVGDGASTILLLGFESADAPVTTATRMALEMASDLGGRCLDFREAEVEAGKWTPAAAGRPGPRTGEPLPGDEAVSEPGRDATSAWRRAFLRAPHVRDALVRLGWICETVETAVTWDRFQTLHAAVLERLGDVCREVCGDGIVAWRVTTVYPDGAAPYYTVVAPGRAGAEVAQWDTIKAAVTDTILAAGGTVTHHHAVGRVHLAGYLQETPEAIVAGLRAVKGVLDPAGVLNPGCLLPRDDDPAPPRRAGSERP